ncbi:thiamine biosynthesis lipoprotein [Desulfotomaculum arcticum]|uniref:FAD:protein FMN transferase n=1 Tax=Desulfotruncus arcticus DSM 17038 TaxID=1121424 RepID=A0A1I2R2U9_9FIRM|nr:FAD:protein FMN transferase [Desulfotruncus arcticus]SFG34710.1 thiamine biosynthesis lipoprotein [Desulfotomaculum arcticum] [Desulfotruncus arcticus DSM 17038]
MKNKSIFLMFMVIFFNFGWLAGCSGNSEIPVEKQGFYMGTVVTVKAYGQKAQRAADEGMKRIKDLQDKMTSHAPDGEIHQLNASAGNGAWVPLSSDSIYVLKTALKYAQLSQGSFDVTIGPLVQSWGSFTQNPQIPSPTELDRINKLINYRDMEINEKEKTARLKKTGQMVDLGGIAKGYAGDEVIKIFKAYGIESAFVNLGGNVVVLGEKPDGSPWNVGIQNPGAQDGGCIGVLEIKDKAVVTSGDYERYFEEGGVRYHHILDPQTGYPSKSGLISVTIVAETSIDADALSTAAFVLGLAEGLELVQSLEGVEAIFITGDRQVHITPGLKDRFTLTDPGGIFQYHEKT